MQIGFVGLGKMGANMVRRLIERGGHEVVVWDRDPRAIAELARAGARGAESPEDLARTLAPPRVIWLMVPAGAPVDEALDALAGNTTRGDVFVDGGNSFYKDSMRRAGALAARGQHLLDAGTSGGVWGRELGYCLMIGGAPEAFAHARPVLETLAPPDGFAHVGASGAGHFCKMVHNGIEYGLMQAYAEGFALMEASPFEFDLAKVATLWNQGSVVRSWLLELAQRAFQDDPRLEKVAAWVDDTGEGRWTVQAAVEHAVPTPAIAAALFARFRSRQEQSFADRVLATLRKQFGGHATKPRA
ncbi:phosphogluconate dehydrogenase (NAD(+)-dependent, decarboxylating) [Sandaracinus amylolyticus]|nr:decarboxylating 6-phosphogluconate dehydrogenase [Sandaracinus amylolyticus]